MKKTHRLFLLVTLAIVSLIAVSCEPQNDTPLPYISAGGIGVSDLDRSIDFYTNVLDLDFAGKVPGVSDRVVEEAVLKDRDGRSIYLMDFGPNEDYDTRPCKMVFAVPNARTYYQRVLANGGSSVSAPASLLGTTVALTRDPDGYIVELMQINSVSRPIMVAMGIGASSLRQSRAYYEDVIGLEYDTGMPVPGLLTERILKSQLGDDERGKGLQLVIMNFQARMDYTDVPAKIVLNVDDAVAFADAIADDDPSSVLIQPTATSTGLATDIDGTLMEIVQD